MPDTPNPREVSVKQATAGIRIEYEIPPTRAIWVKYFEEQPECTDEEWRMAFRERHPHAHIRKIERNIALGDAWHRDDENGHEGAQAE